MWLAAVARLPGAVGGVAAVIDSTVAVNLVFHNTLWVPAHFHTYYLMGVVFMVRTPSKQSPARPQARHAGCATAGWRI